MNFIKIDLSNLYLWFLRITVISLLVSTVILPSGTIYFFNIKILLSVFSFFLLLFINKSIKIWLSLFIFLLFVLFFSLIAMINGLSVNNVISEGVATSSLFFLVFIPIGCVLAGVISINKVFRIIFISLAFYSISKVFISSLFFFDVQLSVLQDFFQRIFCMTFVGLDTCFFYRVSYPIDFLYPISIYIVVCGIDGGHLLFNKKLKYFLLFVYTLGIIISYSRYLYFYCAISFLLTLFSIKFKLKNIIISILLFLILCLVFHNYINNMYDFILNRYFGESAVWSDNRRFEMFSSILSTIHSYPILGRGLGASAVGFIDIPGKSWYYELQWLAICMQFGIVGFSILFTTSVVPVVFCYLKGFSFKLLCITILYALWLATAIFNGFMFSSSGGAVFLVFSLIALYYTKSYF